MEETLNDYIKEYQKQLSKGDIVMAYRGLMNYMHILRNYLKKEYPDYNISGHINYGQMDMTYFTFTPDSLSSKKLKIVLAYNHIENRFEILLAGNNKQIQNEFWKLFEGSDWNKYNIPSNTKDGFAIVDHILVEYPDFNKLGTLTKQVEKEALQFIKDLEDVFI